MKDINLPVSQSQRLETKLKALQETQQPNRDDEFYYYPNSDHQFADVLEEVGTRVRSFSEKAWQNAATP